MPDKDTEDYLLHYLIPARKRVTGTLLTYLCPSERPDFICVRGNHVPIGVEVTRITFGPDDSITDYQAVEQILAESTKKTGT